jgi:hypothetical protein
MSSELELDVLANELRASVQLFDIDWMARTLARRGHRVIPDPASLEIAELVAAALVARRGYSVVRLGDGEANILCYGRATSRTPALDWRAACGVIARQPTRFAPTPDLMLLLHDALQLSVLDADIVGVVGLWQPTGLFPSAEESVARFVGALSTYPEGFAGQLRGRKLAAEMPDYLPTSRIFASAHLYISLIQHLEVAARPAAKIVCITDVDAGVDAVRRLLGDKVVEQISVTGGREAGEPLDPTPWFFDRVKAAIDPDSQGVLYLIGAGPWAEIYCRYAKENGGVAVDIGSGFDLLRGVKTRPVHNFITLPDGIAD